MALPNSEYWIKRFEVLEKAHHSFAKSNYKSLEPVFARCEREIKKEIESWYARYAKNNSLSLTEARRQLKARELDEFKWTVEEYIKYGKQNALDGKWMDELERASTRWHISRLEALKTNIRHQVEVAYGLEQTTLESALKTLYEDGYYRTLYEVQKGIELGWSIGTVDGDKLATVITKPWTIDGRNFSSRIWSAKTQMVNELHTELTRTIAQGKAPDEAIKHMTEYLRNKTANAKYKAGRLVMTEQAFISAKAQADAFRELDVENYKIVATLDRKTSKVCQDMDGKIYPMSQYEIGVTAPPFHPWCRTTTVPYFDDEWGRDGQRVARGKDGTLHYVPSNMKYEEWKAKHLT